MAGRATLPVVVELVVITLVVAFVSFVVKVLEVIYLVIEIFVIFVFFRLNVAFPFLILIRKEFEGLGARVAFRTSGGPLLSRALQNVVTLHTLPLASGRRGLVGL
jgi:hypothetical protein